MLTAPNPADPLDQFNRLYTDLMACSVAILNTPQATPETLAPAVEARASLIRQLSEYLDQNPSLRALDSVQASLQSLVAEDKEVLAHMQALQAQLGRALDEIYQSKNALGSYRFPEIEHSTGIENRG